MTYNRHQGVVPLVFTLNGCRTLIGLDGIVHPVGLSSNSSPWVIRLVAVHSGRRGSRESCQIKQKFKVFYNPLCFCPFNTTHLRKKSLRLYIYHGKQPAVWVRQHFNCCVYPCILFYYFKERGAGRGGVIKMG